MKKGTIAGLLVVLAGGAAVAAGLLGKRNEAPEPAPEKSAPIDPDKTVAFPLKNKYADYSRGEGDPIYRFELETPSGVKEVAVDKEQYESCYIGDEVLCLETGKGYEVVS